MSDVTRTMRTLTDDLATDLRLAMHVPAGGYASTLEVPVVTVPKLLARYLWRYLDDVFPGVDEKQKRKYLDELIDDVRDDEDEAPAEPSPPEDDDPDDVDPPVEDEDFGDEEEEDDDVSE